MPLRRAGLAALVLVAVAVPAVRAAEELSPEPGGVIRLVTDPRSGAAFAILGRSVDRDGVATLDLYARPLDRRGRPAGGETLVATDVTPNLTYNGGEQIGAAYDPDRRRFLLAWSGHEPGMSSVAGRRDHEIFVRALGEDGAPAGDPRRITTTGPAERPEFQAVTPSLAYDRRAGSFLLSFAAAVTGEATRGALFAQALEPDGRPAGEARRLRLRPSELSTAPLGRVVAGPGGGFTFAFTWGEDFNSRELFATRLSAAGRPARVHPVSPAGGPGAGGVELSVHPRRGDALVLWSEARPGAAGGFRARRLGAGGRPAARAARLPLRGGSSPIVAAGDTAGPGWLLLASQEDGSPIGHRAIVRRATRDGRPKGPERTVSEPGENALEPFLAALPRGRFRPRVDGRAPERGGVAAAPRAGVLAQPASAKPRRDWA